VQKFSPNGPPLFLVITLFTSNLANLGTLEGTGTAVRNCEGSSNNSVPRDTKVSAIDVTPKVFFECLCWFQDWDHFFSNSSFLFSHTPTVQFTTISRFPYNFFRMWPLIFCQHTIHQAESRCKMHVHRNMNKKCLYFPSGSVNLVWKSMWGPPMKFHPHRFEIVCPCFTGCHRNFRTKLTEPT